MSNGKLSPERISGWLHKWTNIIKGYQKRWFVLSSGLLSYYRTQDEAKGAKCRGTISLAGASINQIDSHRFVVTNGLTHVYLRAHSEVERQRWVTALELAKATAIKKLEKDDDSDTPAEEDHQWEPLTGLKGQLKEISATYDLVVKNNHQLLKQLIEVEGSDLSPESRHTLQEKMVLFKITAGAMVKASEEFLAQAQRADRKWSRLLQYERSQRLQLQENLEALGRQMHHMEHRASMSLWKGATTLQQLPSVSESSSSLESQDATLLSRDASRDARMQSGVPTLGDDDDDDNKFFDAADIIPKDNWETVESPLESFRSAIMDFPSPTENEPPAASNQLPAVSDQLPVGKENTMIVPVGPSPSFFENTHPTVAKRRTTIPPKPDCPISLWGILKNCIGMDLSKMPIPVNFNEPLSFLQRFLESLIHADLLERAAACDNTLEENAFVVAFAASSYYGTAMRLTKPFNPLLGETYECDRRAELGWRAFIEQVSHHPPMYAAHVEHKDWTLWEEFTVTSKFRGKYLSVYPIGSSHLVLHRSRSHYTWNRVATTIHNIIVGSPWIDQSGEMKVTNHTSSEEGLLEFHAYSYFSTEKQRKVRGSVKDSSGKVQFKLSGYWDEKIESARVIGEGKKAATAAPEVLWKALPESGNEEMYNFSEFSCSLNEPEEGVCPTDSRLRPDQRVMENQDFDTANKEKLRLEEKQRAKRRKREAAGAKAAEAAAMGNHEEAARLEKEAAYSPMWFQKEYDPLTNTMMHVYKGGYWEGKLKGDWGREIPDLF